MIDPVLSRGVATNDLGGALLYVSNGDLGIRDHGTALVLNRAVYGSVNRLAQCSGRDEEHAT